MLRKVEAHHRQIIIINLFDGCTDVGTEYLTSPSNNKSATECTWYLLSSIPDDNELVIVVIEVLPGLDMTGICPTSLLDGYDR